MNAVFNVTMPETMNLRKLENKHPRTVLINKTITKCNGCGRKFKAEDRKEPNNMVSRSMHGRLSCHPSPTYLLLCQGSGMCTDAEEGDITRRYILLILCPVSHPRTCQVT